MARVVEVAYTESLWVHSCGAPVRDHTLKNRLRANKARPILVCPNRRGSFELPDYALVTFHRTKNIYICDGCGLQITGARSRWIGTKIAHEDPTCIAAVVA